MDFSNLDWTQIVIAVILFAMTTILFPLVRVWIAKIKDARVREIINDAVNAAEQWAKNQQKAGIVVAGLDKLAKANEIATKMDGGKSGLDTLAITNLIEAAVGKLNSK